MGDNTVETETPAPFAVFEGDETRGAIRCGSTIIGMYEDGTLVFDLGWLRMANLGVRLLDDRVKGDNHRGGVAFERVND